MDLQVLTYFNQFLGRSPRFDELVVLATNNDLLKGGLFLLPLWWFWFRPSPALADRREIVTATLVSAVVAPALTRLACLVLPYHQRPCGIPGLAPRPFPDCRLDLANSFPSDHAALSMALLTGMFLLSPTLGTVATAYAILVVLLPRIYVGLHWPSDVVVGALVGFAVTVIATRRAVREALGRSALGLERRSPAAFYVVMVLLTFGLMTRFDDVRALASWAKVVIDDHGSIATSLRPRHM